MRRAKYTFGLLHFKNHYLEAYVCIENMGNEEMAEEKRGLALSRLGNLDLYN